MKRIYVIMLLLALSLPWCAARAQNHWGEYVSTNQMSLNAQDRLAFNPGPNPFDRPLIPLSWTSLAAPPQAAPNDLHLSLNGIWDLQEAPAHGISSVVMLNGDGGWKDSIPAHIPCSVQTALFQAGKIKDPMLLENNLGIEWVAQREWWLRRKFEVPKDWKDKNVELRFAGIDYRATFWLNGMRLGQHQGMFGGPDFDISALLYFGTKENELVVRLDPAPPNYKDTLATSVSYGWHYVKLVTLGIWRSVDLQARDGASLGSPFITTAALGKDAATVKLSLNLWKWEGEIASYTLDLSLTPENFQGKSFVTSTSLTLKPGFNRFGFTSNLKDPALWWPVGLGKPNLYTFRCVLRKGTMVVDSYVSDFGVRTVLLSPTLFSPSMPKADIYNNQFVVNGHFIWIRGANWCFPDALLRLTRRRQEHFLRIARNAHIQFIRVWGGGPNYNNALYDLCDELGIMVQQEFPLNGTTHLDNIPLNLVEDMANQMVTQLRNRPSLVVWCGGNEFSGHGKVVDLLGRRVLELDGTRDFWRTDPYGGRVHWYGVYWGDLPLLAYRKAADGRIKTWPGDPEPIRMMAPIAFTEFGLSSPASMVTWKQILPPAELTEWPIRPDSNFVHHTPTYIFLHVQKMIRYSEDFLEPESLTDLIKGMQLSQGVGLKMLIESMRSRKPYTTQTNFYKLTPDYPGASWATIDYYGIPKLSMYLVKEAYRPVHVMSIYNHWNAQNGVLKFSLHAVNDTFTPVQGTLHATLFNAQLHSVWHQNYPVAIPTNKAIQVAAVQYPVPATNSQPLFLLLDLVDTQGKRLDRDWSYYNFTAHRGCLLQRPQTRLTTHWVRTGKDKLELAVQNAGSRPALGVTLDLGDAGVSYYAHQSLFWLQPGEKKTVEIEYIPAPDGHDVPLKQLTLSAWNAEKIVVTVPQ